MWGINRNTVQEELLSTFQNRNLHRKEKRHSVGVFLEKKEELDGGREEDNFL